MSQLLHTDDGTNTTLYPHTIVTDITALSEMHTIWGHILKIHSGEKKPNTTNQCTRHYYIVLSPKTLTVSLLTIVTTNATMVWHWREYDISVMQQQCFWLFKSYLVLNETVTRYLSGEEEESLFDNRNENGSIWSQFLEMRHCTPSVCPRKWPKEKSHFLEI